MYQWSWAVSDGERSNASPDPALLPEALSQTGTGRAAPAWSLHLSLGAGVSSGTGLLLAHHWQPFAEGVFGDAPAQSQSQGRAGQLGTGWDMSAALQLSV